MTAIVVPCVMCDLPLRLIPFDLKWRHLEGILLADPDFGLPGRTEILLVVDIFVEVLHQGRRTGTPGSPSTFETDLVGSSLERSTSMPQVTILCLIMFLSSLEVICCERSGRLKNAQWINPISLQKQPLTKKDGCFIVSLPKKPHAKSLGKSRSQAVRRFLLLK